jgi:small ubiquitin-related modifier
MGAGNAVLLNIKVMSADGNEVYFKVKKTTKMGKVFKAYCQKLNLFVDCVRFLFDGVRVNDNQTPDELDMEGDEEIDALMV